MKAGLVLHFIVLQQFGLVSRIQVEPFGLPGHAPHTCGKHFGQSHHASGTPRRPDSLVLPLTKSYPAAV